MHKIRSEKSDFSSLQLPYDRRKLFHVKLFIEKRKNWKGPASALLACALDSQGLFPAGDQRSSSWYFPSLQPGYQSGSWNRNAAKGERKGTRSQEDYHLLCPEVQVRSSEERMDATMCEAPWPCGKG
jgi:hypothetical protein